MWKDLETSGGRIWRVSALEQCHAHQRPEDAARCPHVGHHERSGASIFLTPDGVNRRTRIARMLEHERKDRVFSATCIGVPRQLRPDQRNLARLVVLVAEADQGGAPVIVMPVVPKTDRRR